MLQINEKNLNKIDKIPGSFMNHREQFDCEKAIECVNKAIELKPSLITALFIKAKILKFLEREDEADVIFSKCKELIRSLKTFHPRGWSRHCSRHIISWIDTDNKLGVK